MKFEIADALRLLRARNDALAKRRNLSAAEQATQVTVAPFRESGYGMLETNGAMFSPLLTLESMGYGWNIDATGRPSSISRYEPSDGEAMGTWLTPPKAGVGIPTVRYAQPK